MLNTSAEFCAAKLHSQTAQRFETPSGEYKPLATQPESLGVFSQRVSFFRGRLGAYSPLTPANFPS
jgi:hypothetical protein